MKRANKQTNKHKGKQSYLVLVRGGRMEAPKEGCKEWKIREDKQTNLNCQRGNKKIEEEFSWQPKNAFLVQRSGYQEQTR